MVSPPFGRNNLSSTDNSILSIITAFVNMEPEIRCKAADFCIYLIFFQNKKLSERTASALLAECADDDIDDQTDRGCDRVDRALLTARLGLGIILFVLLLTASADHAVADLLQDCQRGERGKQQQEQSLNRLHLSG